MKFQTKHIQEKYDYLAPDGSEIRLLLDLKRGNLAHCTLPPKSTSLAVTHKTVEEMWYFIQGEGEVWRKQDQEEEIVKVVTGVCITIPVGTHFQFRNTGQEALHFIIITMPPWPGPQEAVKVKGKWEVT